VLTVIQSRAWYVAALTLSEILTKQASPSLFRAQFFEIISITHLASELL
jgi:hypothetical protein